MNFIIIILFLFLLLFINFINKDFFNPFLVFINFWGFQISICVLFFSNTTEWAFSGLIYIYILCIFLILIKFIFNPKKINKDAIENEKKVNYKIDSKKGILLLSIFIIIGFSYSAILIKKYGFSLNNIFNLKDLLEMNSSTSYQRYYEGFNLGIMDKILLTFVYLSPMCAGYLLAFNDKRVYKLISFLSFTPEMIIFLTENTKAPLIGCIVFFSISWFLGYIIKNGKRPKVNKKRIIQILLILLIIYFMLFISMMFRNGKLDISTYNIVSNKIKNYFFGHIPAFDNWFSNNIQILPKNFGIQTFIGIYDLLGFTIRNQGIYTDSYAGGSLGSNVYTYFRGLVSDFGIIGTTFYISIILLICNKIYNSIINGNCKIIYQVLYILIMSYILFCFVSIFSYNSFTFAFILFYIFLILIKKKVIKDE